MTQPLADANILVADDQSDVARTLCQPLQMAGASLRYVSDGHAALAEMAAHPVDLILIDMKMPPGEWGGLWLLGELEKGGWAVPAVALSGEGSKRQVIEAQRLGAKSWVDKDQADQELLDQSTRLLAEAFQQAIDLAGTRLATPLARRFARFARITDPEKRMVEGLHVLEAVLRFSALVGLSSTPPQTLRGITLEKVRAPSMRTWFDLCTALARSDKAGRDFTRLLSFLIPDRTQCQFVDDLISIRNDIAHGRATPDHVHGDRQESLLRRFAHRSQSSWRADIALPTHMTYDGSSYSLKLLRFSGTGAPIPTQAESQYPLVTGELTLLSRDYGTVALSPWITTNLTDEQDQLHCLLFDGLHRTRGHPEARTPFKYSGVYGGSHSKAAPIEAGTWQELSPWISGGTTDL